MHSVAHSRFSQPMWAGLKLLLATLLMYALGRIEGKKEAIERDRLLLE